MKLLLDQGLARSAVSLLTRHGHDAVHVGDLGMATASDTAILDEAQQQLRTVVTLDADFHALLALRGATTPSVIRLRVQGKKASEIADLIARIVAVCSAELEAGALATSDGERIRVRLLPIA
jgi:predicted nuclease of predicted toxin-antitoxin system